MGSVKSIEQQCHKNSCGCERVCDEHGDLWSDGGAEVVDLTRMNARRAGAVAVGQHRGLDDYGLDPRASPYGQRGVTPSPRGLLQSGADEASFDYMSNSKQGARNSFEVELVRDGEHWRKLGLLVSPDDNPRYLIVDDIWEPSLVSEWNDRHPEARHVKQGHYIGAVNGENRGSEDMLARIQATGKGSVIRLMIM